MGGKSGGMRSQGVGSVAFDVDATDAFRIAALWIGRNRLETHLYMLARALVWPKTEAARKARTVRSSDVRRISARFIMTNTVEFLKSGWLKLNSTRSRQDAAVAATTKHENITRKIVRLNHLFALYVIL